MMKYLSWPGRIMFLMSVSAYLLITFWLFWPYTPITIHSIDIINTDDIYAGEMLHYETKYTKTKSYPVVSVVRQIIDGAVIVLAPGKESRLPTGTWKVPVEVPIPGYACEGKYIFHLTARYQVNPIRTVSVVAMSGPFKIKRRDTKAIKELIESRTKGIQDGRVIHERVVRDSKEKYGVTDQAGN